MTDNVATLQGYTKEIWAECPEYESDFLVRPDADLDDTFRAWDMHLQEFTRIKGWLWIIDCEPDKRDL
jgi:hypothetical protein